MLEMAGWLWGIHSNKSSWLSKWPALYSGPDRANALQKCCKSTQKRIVGVVGNKKR